MKFLSSEKLSAHKYKTPEGYLICTDAILARTGKQTYRKNEVFSDSNDDSEIEVDRRPEEVFAPETLASFENKPITVEHPDENVSPENYNELSVGFVRDVHQGKIDGQDVMLGTLVITDARTIDEIENGEHTDLSCGYDCDIVDEENPQQRNIRGNHVALCQQGRAGIARIVDSIKDNMTSKEFDYWSYHAIHRPNDRNKLNRIIDLFYRNGYKLFDYDDEDFDDELSNAYANASSSLKNQINAIIKDSKLVDSIKDTHDSYLIQSKYNADNYFDNDGYFHLNKHTAMRFNTYEEATKKARALYSDWQEHVNIVNDSIKDDDLPKKGDKYTDGRYTFIITSTYAPFGSLSVIDLVREDGEKYTVGQNEFIRHFRRVNDSIKDRAIPSSLINALNRKLEEFKRRGYDESDLEIKVEGNKIWFTGELSYNTHWKLAEELDKILQKYNKDAYFDAETSGRWFAVYDSITKDDIESIPSKARQEMTKSSNKAATLLSILNELQQEVDKASDADKAKIKEKANKILNDLKKQFNLTSETYIKLDDAMSADDIAKLVKDIMHDEQIRISRWSNDGKITLSSDQLYSTDVDTLCRAIKRKGFNCKILNTTTVQVSDAFMSKMEMPEQSMKDAKSISQLRQDIRKLLAKAANNPGDSTLRDFAYEYKHIINQSDEWFAKNKSLIEEDLSMFEEDLKDSLKDSLVEYEYKIIDDVIKSCEFKTTDNIIKALNEQYPGFAGSHMTDILNYLKKKNIKDSKLYVVSYKDNDVTYIKKVKATSALDAYTKIKKSK